MTIFTTWEWKQWWWFEPNDTNSFKKLGYQTKLVFSIFSNNFHLWKRLKIIQPEIDKISSWYTRPRKFSGEEVWRQTTWSKELGSNCGICAFLSSRLLLYYFGRQGEPKTKEIGKKWNGKKGPFKLIYV